MLKSYLQKINILLIVISFLAVILPESVSAEEFEIILLSKPSKDYDGNSCLALLSGGYLDGLNEEMEGVLKQKDTYRVIIQDVTAYESACIIEGITLEEIVSGVIVNFDLQELGAHEFRTRASNAFTSKRYERALYYLSELIKTDSTNNDSSVQELITNCQKEIELEKNRKLSRKGRRAEAKRTPVYYKIGAFFFNQDKYEAAKFYLEKVVQYDKKNEHAKGLLCIIDKGIPCNDPVIDESNSIEIYPKMLYQHPPDYPRIAKQAGITGTVWVKALIDKSGLVLKTDIWKSSGSMALDQSAIISAYYCRFQPAIQDGKPIACWVKFKLEFTLDY